MPPEFANWTKSYGKLWVRQFFSSTSSLLTIKLFQDTIYLPTAEEKNKLGEWTNNSQGKFPDQISAI